MFLRYDADRTGFITRENMKDLFRKISLPLDDDIITAVNHLKRCSLVKINFFSSKYF